MTKILSLLKLISSGISWENVISKICTERRPVAQHEYSMYMYIDVVYL